MIKIYSDGNLLHHQYVDDLKVTSAVVEKIQNGVGSFKFTMEASNPFIDSIIKRKSIITVYDDSYLLFKGICLDIDIGFRNTKTFYCKEDPYFLTYTVSRPYEFSGTPAELFSKFITEHNSNASDEMKFKVGTVTVTDPNNLIVREDSTYLTTWDGIQKKLIEPLGGYLTFRHETDGTYIDYLDDYNTQNVQEVNFGKNLIDVNQTETSDEIFTVIIPLGAKVGDERIDITSVNDGKDYIENADGIELYGRITKMVVWDDVTLPVNLETKAQSLLSNAIQQVTEITLKAVDLNNVDKDIQAFRMHNYIKVISDRNGINDYYLPLKMTINLFKPEQNTIELNVIKKGLTDYQSGEIKTVYETVTKEVGDMQGKMLVKYETEYTVSDSATEIPTEGWSTDTPEWEEGKYIWERTKTTKGDGTVSYTAPVVRNSEKGKDAILLRIDSTRGTVFKNNQVGTVLTVVIFYGSQKIETNAQLKQTFGTTSYLQWEWQRMDDDAFGVISLSDTRLSDGGFKFTISPDDVDVKTVFRCNLIGG